MAEVRLETREEAEVRRGRRAWAERIADQYCVFGSAVIDAIEEGIARGRLLERADSASRQPLPAPPETLHG